MRAVVQMVHLLKLSVAESVATDAQRGQILGLGSDGLQRYLFATL